MNNLKQDMIYLSKADNQVSLTVLRDENTVNAPCIIVLPGGAYAACAPGEGYPVAEHFAKNGYVGCVLKYSTLYRDFSHTEGLANRHTVFPEPLWQVASAIAHLRENASLYGLNPSRIALCGFSAGAHLAANYCNYWGCDEFFTEASPARDLRRPGACVLSYGATHLNANTPGVMHRAVTGKLNGFTQEELDVYNARLHVNRDTPPCFLWHTADDNNVPAERSFKLAEALLEEGIVCELHIFSSGPHAAALSKGLPAEKWPELADAFLKRVMPDR